MATMKTENLYARGVTTLYGALYMNVTAVVNSLNDLEPVWNLGNLCVTFAIAPKRKV